MKLYFISLTSFDYKMVRSADIRPEKYRGMKAGREFEADLLGTAEINDPKYADEVRKIVKEIGKPYIPYRQALELVKNFQSGDPTNPKKDFLRELRLAVADKLGLETDEDLEGLRAYTAVGTPLDILHGVDGFISFGAPDKKEGIVTFDVTLQEDKQTGGGKADLIIGDLPDPDEDEAGYLAAIEKVAEQIARKFQRPEA
jgi:hypothetical protein